MFIPFKVTLRAARESHGYTVEEVAKYCRISTKKMEALELDSDHITYEILAKLTRLYAIPLDYIHFGKNEDCYKFNREQAAAYVAEWAAANKKEVV